MDEFHDAEWLTPARAMAEFGYSYNWLRYLRATNTVETRREQLSWVYSRKSLAAYQQRQAERRAAKHAPAKGTN